MRRINTRDLVVIAFFIAIQIILTRFCSIQTPIVRLDFNFLALYMCAALYGPLWGGVAGAIADFIGVSLFSAMGGWFPGLTLSMFLVGVVYGLFFYEKQMNYFRITCAVLIVMGFISLVLDTTWLVMLTGKAFIALLPLRLLKCVVMTPVQIILIRATWETIGKRLSVYLEAR